MKNMKLTIKRRRWWRGKEYHFSGSALRMRHNGMQCCLGFLCAALGATPKEMLGRPLPSSLDASVKERIKLPLWLRRKPADRAANINDSDGLTDDVREARITSLFRRHGVNVRFV